VTSGERITYEDAAEDIDLDSAANVTWSNTSDEMLIINEQKGRRFAGTWGEKANGKTEVNENIIGVIGYDNITFYMVDEDSFFEGRLQSPAEMEFITRKTDSGGMLAATSKLTRLSVEMSDQDIQIKNTSALRVASLMAKGLPFQETVPKAYNELIDWMRAKGLPAPVGSPWGVTIYFDDPKSVYPSEVRFKVAIPVPNETKLISKGKAAIEVLPEREVAYITIHGTYENLEYVYNRLNAWIIQNGLSFADAPREVMIKYGENIQPQEWITEVQFPIGR
jgi:effector-binding domain-containing protein